MKTKNLKFKILLFILIFITYNLQLTTSYAASDIAYIEKLFMEGKYGEAASESGRLINARSRHRDELYYIKGLSELKLNRFSDARLSFEGIISGYQKSKRIFDAHVGIGDSYFLEGRTDAAIRSYNDMLNKFPKENNIAIVHSRIAECNKRIPSGSALQDNGGSFSVQVGSFKNKNNAEALARKLSRQGYEAYVELPVKSGDRFYRVRVGHTKSSEGAGNLASRLKRSGYSTKICTDDTCQ